MISRLRKRFSMAIVLATVLAAIVSLVAAAETIDPSASDAQYAWGENVGWLNAEPSGNGGPGVTVSGAKLTGYMWGENIGWINMNCLNNATCGTTGNYGVTNNGSGALKGYAWGENVGWISFSCQNVPATCAGTGNYGVTIDPLTGLFSGKAWGENIGWLVFDYTTSAANRVKTDDGDGIAFPTDNCPFDNNPTQVNTDAAVAWPWIKDGAAVPEGATLGGDACDTDNDNDGCSNAREAGADWHTGGQRDSTSPWDFADVPVPALLPTATTGVRSRFVSLADVLATLAYVGTNSAFPTTANANGAKYGSDINGNGVVDGREYDRTPSVVAGEGWHSGAPNGFVSLADVLVVLASVGSNCT